MVAVVVAFATLLTAHVTLVFGLAARSPRWRGVVGAVVPPLAPFWGSRAGMKGRSFMWVAGALAYAVARWAARR